MKTWCLIILLVHVASLFADKLILSVSYIDNETTIRFENHSNAAVVIKSDNAGNGGFGCYINSQQFYASGLPYIEKKGNSEIYIWRNDTYSFVLSANKIKNGFDVSIAVYLNGTKIQPDKWFAHIDAEEGEYFTGISERVVDGEQDKSWESGITAAMNLRGSSMELKLKPTLSAYAPFYVSSKPYGIFFHGTWPGHFDFCKTDSHKVRIEMEGEELRFRLYLNKSVSKIIARHAKESGPSILPPLWALGPWRWRDEVKNKPAYFENSPVNSPFNSQITEDILMMEAFDIPCTAYWIDRPWGIGSHAFDDYIIDSIRLPNLTQMTSWLNRKNIQLMMWIGPFVMGQMAEEANAKGYGLTTKEIKDQHTLVDFTNPEACSWWAEKGLNKLAKMGIRGFKLDRADGETELDYKHLKTHIGTSYRENYNDYPRQYVKAAYDAVRPILGNDFILFPRAQYTGSSRFGAMWAGDTKGSAEGLRSAVIALLRCSVMGYPIHGSDIGGYWGKEIFQRETAMRWLAFGCFSPIMEVGPTHNKGFWGLQDEPRFDSTLMATWRLYAKTRIKLMPYIYKLAKEARKTGMPIARPLFLSWPEQNESWSSWQTYTLGSDILISPVWEVGKTIERVYLPKGEMWVDGWNTDKVYAGGQFVDVDVGAPYKIPIFIRKGSSIQLGNLQALYDTSFEMTKSRPSMAELERKEVWK